MCWKYSDHGAVLAGPPDLLKGKRWQALTQAVAGQRKAATKAVVGQGKAMAQVFSKCSTTDRAPALLHHRHPEGDPPLAKLVRVHLAVPVPGGQPQGKGTVLVTEAVGTHKAKAVS